MTTGRGTVRILSLDGGGTWALIQARALHTIFGDEATGWDVLRAFDLVVANSGGSIVAGALVSDLKLSQIAPMFENEARRRSMFVEKAFVGIRRGADLPKYETAAKHEGLASALGTPCREIMTRWKTSASDKQDLADVLITGFDYDAERAVYYRTFRESLASSAVGSTSPVAVEASFLDAIHASTTPPVLYFDEPAQQETSAGSRRLWDGAMAGYNNPIVAGVVEVLANHGRYTASRDSIRVLSIGTGKVPPLAGETSEPGFFADIRKAATSIIDDPPDTATFVAHMMLDDRVPTTASRSIIDSPIVRMNPVARISAGGVTPEEHERLSQLALDVIEQEDVDHVTYLCERWLDDKIPNQPIRPSGGLEPADIGHDTFSRALAQYRNWT